MDKRLELHETLCGIINITESDGDRHTYFQPPASLKLKYPAIVYVTSAINKRSANNLCYMQSPGYTVTLIDANPDSEYVQKILQLPYCRFDRAYTADNLNHFVFTLHHY